MDTPKDRDYIPETLPLSKELEDISTDEQKKLLMHWFDLESIRDDARAVGYLILKKKDDTYAIYSLRTKNLIKFPTHTDGVEFTQLSVLLPDVVTRMYMAVGGTEKNGSLLEIEEFYILQDDEIKRIPMTEVHSFESAIIQYGIGRKFHELIKKWEHIGDVFGRLDRLLQNIEVFHPGNTTYH